MVLIHPYLNASFNPEVSLLEEDLPDITKHSMGITIQPSDLNKYDVVILAVNHTEYEPLYSGEWILPNQVIFDVKSVIRSDKVLSL